VSDKVVHSALGSFRNIGEAMQAAEEHEAASNLRPYPPDVPHPNYRESQWMTLCTAAEVDILRELSARLQDALDAMPKDEEGLTEEVHFQHLWIGLLIGSGFCKSFDRAYAWASYVRYNTSDLVA
jgi:hypothetical protein